VAIASDLRILLVSFVVTFVWPGFLIVFLDGVNGSFFMCYIVLILSGWRNKSLLSISKASQVQSNVNRPLGSGGSIKHGAKSILEDLLVE
jgi:hypothetical protein